MPNKINSDSNGAKERKYKQELIGHTVFYSFLLILGLVLLIIGIFISYYDINDNAEMDTPWFSDLLISIGAALIPAGIVGLVVTFGFASEVKRSFEEIAKPLIDNLENDIRKQILDNIYIVKHFRSSFLWTQLAVSSKT